MSPDPTERRMYGRFHWLPSPLTAATVVISLFSAMPIHSEETQDSGSEFDLSEFDSPWHFGGFFRQSLSGLKPFYPIDKSRTDLVSESRLRLAMEYVQGPWQVEGSGNADFLFTNHPESPAFAPLYLSRIRNRALSLETLENKGDYVQRADVHRMTVAYRGQDFHATVGRQAISWGEGRLINPMDLITPVSPLIFDVEDVPGADAVSTTYFLNSYDSVQMVIVPYTRSDERNLSRVNSADSTAILRFKGTFGNLDFVALGGQQSRSLVWGTELNLTVAGAGLRFAYLGRQENEDYHTDYLAKTDTHQIVVGASYAFFGKLRSNLEFFYNSNPHRDEPYIIEQLTEEGQIAIGARDPLPRDESFFRTTGRILTRNPYLLQGSLGYDLLDTLSLDGFILWDFEGGSVLYGPQLGYSATDEIIIVAGARLYRVGRHPEEAEFAGLPPQAFVYLRWHF